MDKNLIINSIKQVREKTKKRNFNQTFDFIVNLKNINIKKEGEKVDLFLVLPYKKSNKKVKVCIFVDKTLEKKATGLFDQVILKEDFLQWKDDKKSLKKLVNSHSFFVAQASLMPDIAKIFGKVLGVKGKMPNPKAGCVVTPDTNLNELYERLQKIIRLETKIEPILKIPVGSEDMKDEEISENILTIYNTIIPTLSQEKQNIKSMMLKLTMSSSFQIEETEKAKVVEVKR